MSLSALFKPFLAILVLSFPSKDFRLENFDRFVVAIVRTSNDYGRKVLGLLCYSLIKI